MMNRCAVTFWVSFVASVLVSLGARTARAQPYDCGSPGSPYSQSCMLAYAQSGTVPIMGQSTDAQGIYGNETNTGQGVLGQSSSGIGVAGVGDDSGYTLPTGVFGGYFLARNGGKGVWGDSDSSAGVYGNASTGSGVHGETAATDNAHAGVWGVNSSSGVGVYGTSTSGYAVWGAGNSGLGGYFTSQSAGALTAISYASGATNALYTTCAGTGCYAAYFDGNVNIYNGCLQFNGTTYHGTCASDRRLKQNIEPVKDGLERLVRLNGVTYEWKDTTGHAGNTGETGFIAQDVEQVFPKWVGTDKGGFKTLDIPPRELAALEIDALKTLKAKNDALAERLKASEAKSDKQQAEINELRDMVLTMKNGRDPISQGPGFDTGTLALMGLGLGGFAGASRLLRRKREEEKRA
jgi:Chaperone of endosialidase